MDHCNIIEEILKGYQKYIKTYQFNKQLVGYSNDANLFQEKTELQILAPKLFIPRNIRFIHEKSLVSYGLVEYEVYGNYRNYIVKLKKGSVWKKQVSL